MKRLSAAKFNFVLAYFLLFVSMACSTSQNGEVSPTPILVTEYTPKPTSTETPIPPTVTTTLTRTPWPTFTTAPTTQPTYSPNETLAIVLEFMETNADCQLPCWWGFTPGKTRADIAFNFISALKPSYLSGDPRLNEFTIQIDTPTANDPDSFVTQTYFTQRGIIESISTGSLNNKLFSIQRLLADYGQPDEIRVLTSDHHGEFPGLLARFGLLYSTKGILAMVRFEGEVVGDNIRVCPQREINTWLGLWSAGEELTFGQASSRTGSMGIDTLRFKQLQDVTNLSLEEFYFRYREEGSRECLETPRETWR